MQQKHNRFAPAAQDAKPLGRSPGARLWYLLTTHVSRLLRANLLCVLYSVPIVTIPAALCALHAVVLQYYRIGYGDVFSTFWKEFRAQFFQKTLFTVLLLALPVLGWLLGSSIAEWLSYALAGILAVLALCTLCWLYPQLALLRLKPAAALRNALLLTAIESWRNLLLLVILLAAAVVMLVAWPLSLLFLLVIFPIVPVVLLTAVTMPVLEERLIREPSPEDGEGAPAADDGPEDPEL